MVAQVKEPREQLINDEEMAAKLSLTVEQVRKLARQGKIPCVRFSRKLVRFDPARVFEVVGSAS